MRSLGIVFGLVLLLASPSFVRADATLPAYQVVDLAPNTPQDDASGSGYVSSFQPARETDLFLAPSGAGGRSIWRTDGTPSGTYPVVSGVALGLGDLVGSNGVQAYFATRRGGSFNAVWATDGTSAGTVLLKTGLGYPWEADSTKPVGWVLDGRLYFHDCRPQPFIACDLWTSDGTIEGTRKLAQMGSYAAGMVGSLGAAYFFAREYASGQFAIWTTDGTPGGTRPLRNVLWAGGGNQLAAVRGRALAIADGVLWAVNSEGVEPVAEAGGVAFSLFDATVEEGTLFFVRRSAGSSTPGTVWRSDGTPGGTVPLLSFTASGSRTMANGWVRRHGARLYYLLPSAQNERSWTLWSSGLVGEEAQPVACDGCGSIQEYGWLERAGSGLYFPAVVGEVRSLWAIDAEQVPHLVKPIRSEPSVLGAAGSVEGRLMFTASLPDSSLELWVSDGSSIGTRTVGTYPVMSDSYVSTHRSALLFGASSSPRHQTSLWLSRGTPESTIELSRLEGEGSSPGNLLRAGDRLQFLACRPQRGVWGAGSNDAELLFEGSVDCDSSSSFNPSGSVGESAYFGWRRYSTPEVWATGGTAASTRKVWDGGTDGGFVCGMVAFGGDLVFCQTRMVAEERLTSLWRSDGTSAGTTKLLDLPPNTGPTLSLTPLGGTLFFRAASPVLQIWQSDGTPEGTRRLTDVTTFAFVEEPEFTRVGPFVFFSGADGIWRTDGTASGTSLVIPGPVDDDPNGREGLMWLHEQAGALLYMRSENGVSSLWRSLGTAETAEPIAHLTAVTWPPRSAVSFGGYLFFAASDAAHGIELWRTDGTVAGTELVRDIGLGPISGNPRELVVARGKLYFTADDAFAGSELWVTDGTTGGTHLVEDIASHAASSAPAELTEVGDLLYFSADDGSTGRELWALPLPALPTSCTPGDFRLCLNAKRFQVEVSWRDFAGNTGRGHALPLSADTGTFWFFDAANVELIVKALDGGGINRHSWLFYGALSNVEYVVTVTDTRTGAVKTYLNPSGRFASVGDTSAFPTGVTPSASATSTTIPSDPAPSLSLPSGDCVPSGTRLCLQGERFAVEAAWEDFSGNRGAGPAGPISADTGYFWFFGPANVEVVTKVLDGRPLNEKFWVFYGALSNVEYTLTVTDTVTGAQRQYHNPSGRFASVGDPAAF